MKHTIFNASLLLVLPLFACTQVAPAPAEQAQSESPAPTSSSAPAADQAVAAGAHTVKCGCVIEEVGHCGNYISIDGSFLPIANGKELGLGRMEWCGQGAVSVQAAGSVKGGEFIASTLDTDG
ncbi:MAG: hypothetical protein QF724_04445 [Planctomycetota bacterium]|jgi:hypothetical protein|nr:hypothetical protein [Planctomycetota bacterium]MDP6519723.1 hypothetical protein [Planctomycetota bacterium]MDP6838165.1 hypothetical protein [Planctomycetota bacterium]